MLPYSRSVTVSLILLHLEMEMCVIISVCWLSPGKVIQLGEREPSTDKEYAEYLDFTQLTCYRIELKPEHELESASSWKELSGLLMR